jgi:hypothetical protein
MATEVYWAALESLDADLIADQFAHGGSFQLGSASPLTGRVAIRRAFLHLFLDLDSVEGKPASYWEHNGLSVCDADLLLKFTDGTRMMICATTVLWTGNGEILSCRVVMDPVPRLARYFDPEFLSRNRVEQSLRYSMVDEQTFAAAFSGGAARGGGAGRDQAAEDHGRRNLAVPRA